MTGNKRSAKNAQNTCMAEDICVHKTCGKAYDHTATNFPFTIDYQKTTSQEATTFDFRVSLPAHLQGGSMQRCDYICNFSQPCTFAIHQTCMNTPRHGIPAAFP